MFRRILTLLIPAVIAFSTTALAVNNGNGHGIKKQRMLGKGHPFMVRDLPRGRLRSKLESLPAPAWNRAVEWLQKFEFPEDDLTTMAIDEDGAILYIDPAPTHLPTETTPAEGPLPQQGPTAADDAFQLHSRPGAPNVLFLDFDGHTFSNTAWSGGTLRAKAFDLDGNPGSFNNEERNTIAEVWHRVSEDFAPFNIDVTTEVPASFGRYTGRVLITSRNQVNGSPMPHNSAGGVAYVGVWGLHNYASYYSPALVYYDNLADSPTYIAEASSHEFGHNLGLSHDGSSSSSYYSGHGSGANSWAPIMGNSYTKNVTQWSKGEYQGANNSQDDLAIITDNLALATDDHGNTRAAATPLVVDASGQVMVSNPELDPHNDYPNNKGIIETDSDSDLFSFQVSGGQVDLTVTPAWDAFYRDNRRGANLDVSLSLLNANGNTLASSNPNSETDANILVNVSAGTYYLAITGSGSNNYSGYASNGEYFISGTLPQSGANQPPSAGFTYSCDDLSCSFSDNSNDGDGNITAWLWDFGDGASSSQRNPSHTFPSIGSYAVSLRVTDNDGDSDVAIQNISVNIENPPPPPTGGIDFNNNPLKSFSSEDKQGTATIQDNGATLRLTGNTWKRIDFPYTISPNTVIEFDFYSGTQGEIHGIGLENDNKHTPARIFELHGTQNWGNNDFDNYPGSGWTHYRIPVGQYYTGGVSYLVFVMDDDANVQGESRFRNVNVYEDQPTVVEFVDFNDYSLRSFSSEDKQGTASVEDNGATLRLIGNTWKRIDFPYTISPNTVIEFDFYSGTQGEIHGIGLENDNKHTPARIFELHGTQNWGNNDFDNYPGSGWTHYRIPVGQYYTGGVSYLVFVMDDDANVQGESRFRNVNVYEDQLTVVEFIDFNDYSLRSFSSEDKQGTASVEDNGATLRLVGNRWKRIDFPYTISPNTVIEFDFYSGTQGEIHGIGLENDNKHTSSRIFRIYGSQNWGNGQFDNYTGNGWTHYRIPVGQFYTGSAQYLVFVMDDDANAAGESRFRNVSILEE